MEMYLKRVSVYEDEKMALWYYPESKIVHHKMKKLIYGDDFKKLLMTGLDVFLMHGCKKWLSDDRNNPVLMKEDIEWGNKHWQPEVLKAGWKYWAVVKPKDLLSQIPITELIEMYQELDITTKVFDDDVKAYLWLAGLEC